MHAYCASQGASGTSARKQPRLLPSEGRGQVEDGWRIGWKRPVVWLVFLRVQVHFLRVFPARRSHPLISFTRWTTLQTHVGPNPLTFYQLTNPKTCRLKGNGGKARPLPEEARSKPSKRSPKAGLQVCLFMRAAAASASADWGWLVMLRSNLRSSSLSAVSTDTQTTHSEQYAYRH